MYAVLKFVGVIVLIPSKVEQQTRYKICFLCERTQTEGKKSRGQYLPPVVFVCRQYYWLNGIVRWGWRLWILPYQFRRFCSMSQYVIFHAWKDWRVEVSLSSPWKTLYWNFLHKYTWYSSRTFFYFAWDKLCVSYVHLIIKPLPILPSSTPRDLTLKMTLWLRSHYIVTMSIHAHVHTHTQTCTGCTLTECWWSETMKRRTRTMMTRTMTWCTSPSAWRETGSRSMVGRAPSDAGGQRKRSWPRRLWRCVLACVFGLACLLA